MNAATPKSSPITTPPKIDVIIPPNIYDPLHLLDNVDSIEYEQLLISPMKRKMKHRNRKKKPKKKHESPTRLSSANVSTTSVVASEQGDPDVGELFINTDDDEQAEDQGKLPSSSKKREVVDGRKDSISEREKCTRDLRLDLEPAIQLAVASGRKRRISENCQNKNKSRRLDSMDKIVSPVIPQPGAWKRPPILLPMGAPRHRVRNSSTSISEEVTTPDINTTTSSSDTIGHCSSADDAVTLADDPSTSQADNVMLSASTSAANPTQSANIAGDGHQQQQQQHQNQQQQQQCVTNLPTQSKYQYGNYNRYYGFNSLTEFTDVRLKIFQRHSYLFKDKDILDIGCNVGHMSIAVGRKLHPKSLLGIDIDASLISRARHNASLYVKILPEQNKNDGPKTTETTKRPKHNKRDRHRDEYYPISFPICYGGVPQLCETESIKDLDNKESEPSTSKDAIANAANDDENTPLKIVNSRTSKTANSFPNNIFFRTYNYVLTDDTQLANDTPQYDLILCLSVTKWIHLNFGDVGLKLTFKRIFNQLRPGGKLILEAQNWASYKKKKKLTVSIVLLLYLCYINFYLKRFG